MGGRWPDLAAALPPLWGCPPRHRGRGVGPVRSGAGSTPGRPTGLSPRGSPACAGGLGEEAGGHQIQIAAEEGGEKTGGRRQPGERSGGGKERGGSGRGVWKTLRERGSGWERRHGGRRGKAEVSGEGQGGFGHPRLQRGAAAPARPPRSARPPPARQHHGGQGPLTDFGHHLLPVHRGGDLRGAGGAALALGYRRLQAAEDGAAQAVPLPGPRGAGQDPAGTAGAAGPGTGGCRAAAAAGAAGRLGAEKTAPAGGVSAAGLESHRLPGKAWPELRPHKAQCLKTVPRAGAREKLLIIPNYLMIE